MHPFRLVLQSRLGNSLAGQSTQLGNSCPNPSPLPPWPLHCFLHCTKDPPVARVPTSKARLVSNPWLARYDLFFALLALLHVFYWIFKQCTKHHWGQITKQFHSCLCSNCCWISNWHVSTWNTQVQPWHSFEMSVFPKILVFLLKVVETKHPKSRNTGCKNGRIIYIKPFCKSFRMYAGQTMHLITFLFPTKSLALHSEIMGVRGQRRGVYAHGTKKHRLKCLPQAPSRVA